MQKGFTLVELMVSLAILLVLFALTSVNLTRIPSSSNMEATYQTLVSDVKYQQTLAMAGATGNTSDSQNFGVRFESNRYVLFTGAVYNPSDPSNFSINLDPPLSISTISFPGGVMVFSKGSGEILDYSPGNDFVSLVNGITGEIKTLRLNKNGASYE